MDTVKDILIQLGYKLKDYGRQYSTTPLYRNSDNPTALTINKETGEFYDFVEGFGGPFEVLIEKTLGTPITPEIKNKLKNNLSLELRKKDIDLPVTKTFDKTQLFKLKKDHTYWNKRGISNCILEKFEGGVAVDGKMMNRYVFPIFNEKKDLVGFSGRYLWENNYIPRWKHVGAKSSWTYPLFFSSEYIIKQKSVILVESIGDFLALSQCQTNNVLITFGVVISTKIIEALLKLNVNHIYISFNNDSNKNSVGNKAALEAEQKLLNYFDQNQVKIALPIDKKDFSEMSSEEIQSWKTMNLNH